jgi:GAF domain-containing protein
MEYKHMVFKPGNESTPLTTTQEKDTYRQARLLSQMTWAAIVIALVISVTLWLVGAPLAIILLMAPLVLIGIMILITTKQIRTALQNAYQRYLFLEVNYQSAEARYAGFELRATREIDDLNRRTQLLERCIEITRSLNMFTCQPSTQVDNRLMDITALMCDRLGLLTVNLFMVDSESHQETKIMQESIDSPNLRLRASFSKGGRQPVNDGYTLTFEQQSCVTGVARTRAAMLDDIAKPATPAIEATNNLTEIAPCALPLAIGENLLGVIELQTPATSPFRPDEVSILQMVADHLAFTIERLAGMDGIHQVVQQTSQEDRVGNQARLSQDLHNKFERGFRAASSGDPLPVDDNWPPMMIEARESGTIVFGDPVVEAYALAVPVKIRNQVAGVVRLRKANEAGEWRPEEVALVERLSDRLSAALESARLFEETRRSAIREHLTGEITTRMRSTNDPQIVLQIAARELRKALRADKAQLLVKSTVTRPATEGDNCSIDFTGDRS